VPVLAPRSSYLHVCCAEALESLSECAVQSSLGAWFVDRSGGGSDQSPLRWTVPVGVLFDGRREKSSLPWTLEVNFGRYPADYIPTVSSLGREEIFRHHLHSVKQSLFILTGGSSAALTSLNRALSENLWKSLSVGDGMGYDSSLRGVVPAGTDVQRVPVRIYVSEWDETGPARCLQRPVEPFLKSMGKRGVRSSLQHVLEEWLGPGLFHCGSSEGRIMRCTVQGVTVPMDAVMADLWEWLMHPDLFLYVNVVLGDK